MVKTSFFARLSHSRHTFINERKELQICNSQLSCMLLMKVYKNVLGQAYLSVKLPTVVQIGAASYVRGVAYFFVKSRMSQFVGRTTESKSINKHS